MAAGAVLGGLAVASCTTLPPAAAPRTVRVAAIQCPSRMGDVAANTRQLTDLVRQAAGQGAKIIVLPELAVTGYLSQDAKTNWLLAGRPIEKDYVGRDPAPFAEPVPGPSTRHFCALARELRVYLTIPLLEVDYRDGLDKPRYFNTVCLADPRGALVLHYRKLTPWPYAEKSWATAGDRGLQIYDTEYGRVGIGICYDIHTIMEKYRGRHLWTLLYPVAWAAGEHPAEWFYHQLPDRVKTFHHHLVAANWSVDGPQGWRGFGFSVVISNAGRVLAAARSLYGADIICADLPVDAGP